MTDRERLIRCVNNEPIDRAPFFFYFGPWPETFEAWKEQGVTDPCAWCSSEIGFDSFILTVTEQVNLLYYPCFEEKILEEKNGHIISQDSLGVIFESIKDKSGIPKVLKNPVTCREDWEKIRDERLNPDLPERFSPHFEAYVKTAQETQRPVQVGSWPYGLFGTLREMWGVEELCCMFYEEPELIHEMMDYLTDMWLKIYEKISQRVQIDIIHIWEDMSGKNGSIISPRMVREFMLPNYKKICDFADKHNIRIVAVDTDGICDELIPLFSEVGINLMMPFDFFRSSLLNFTSLALRFAPQWGSFASRSVPANMLAS